jgi:hypothetical protein
VYAASTVFVVELARPETLGISPVLSVALHELGVHPVEVGVIE